MGRLRQYFTGQPESDELSYEARRYSDRIIGQYGLTPNSSAVDVMSAVSNDFEKDREILRKKLPLIGGVIGSVGLWGLDTKTKDVTRRLQQIPRQPKPPVAAPKQDPYKKRSDEINKNLDNGKELPPYPYDEYKKEFKKK